MTKRSMLSGCPISFVEARRREIGGRYDKNGVQWLPIVPKESKFGWLQKWRCCGIDTASRPHESRRRPCSGHEQKLHLLNKPIRRCSREVRGAACSLSCVLLGTFSKCTTSSNYTMMFRWRHLATSVSNT